MFKALKLPLHFHAHLMATLLIVLNWQSFLLDMEMPLNHKFSATCSTSLYHYFVVQYRSFTICLQNFMMARILTFAFDVIFVKLRR
jgi:hypothetical protein